MILLPVVVDKIITFSNIGSKIPDRHADLMYGSIAQASGRFFEKKRLKKLF
jgi:hypothetical protein